MQLEAVELEAWAADVEARQALVARRTRDRDRDRRPAARALHAVIRRVTGARARDRERAAFVEVASARIASDVGSMLEAGDVVAADRAVLDGRRRHPGRIELLVLHAEVAMAAGEWGRAIERWRRLMDLFGEGAPEEAGARLAAALRSSGDMTAALDVLEHAGQPRTVSGRIALVFERAATRMALGDLVSAERDWRSLLDDGDLPGTLRAVVREALTSTQRASGRTPDEDLRPERVLADDHRDYAGWLTARIDRPAVEVAATGSLPSCAVIVLDMGDAVAVERTRAGALDGVDQGIAVHVVDGTDVLAVEERRRASGADLVLLVEAGTLIERRALDEARRAFADDDDLSIVMADEDVIDAVGRRGEPQLRSAFDPELLVSHPALGHAVVLRSSAIDAVGGLRDLPGMPVDRSHALLFTLWDVALRITADPAREGAGRPSIGTHVADVLLHRPEASVPVDWVAGPSWSSEATAAVALVRGCIDPDGTEWIVEPAPWGVPLHVRPSAIPSGTTVTVVIPTRDRAELLAACVDGLLHRTSLGAGGETPSIDLEIVIVDNDTREPDALALLDRLRVDPRVQVIPGSGEFNFSRLVNAGIAAATGEVCILLNNDVVVLEHDWLVELVVHALRPEVGAVGALLEHSDGRVQHAGVLIGVNGSAEHAFREWPSRAAGYLALLRSTRQVSAVTAACLAMRREVYEQVGGLDESALPVELNDVDLCLRIGEAGLAILWTPFARLAHREGGTRGRGDRATADTDGSAVRRREDQRSAFVRRWRPRLEQDPFYSPRLSVSGATYLLRR